MRRALTYLLMCAALATVSAGTLHAQKYPERRQIRSGNKEYNKGNYPQSEVAYKRALELDPASYEAQFNVANAYYRQERYDESAKMFMQLAADSTAMPLDVAHSLYNAGNAYFGQRQLQESLEAYKNSLRINPGDMDTKFNYAYVKKMLEEQEGDGGGQDDQDQDQDQQDQDQDQDQQGDGQQDQDQGGQDQQDQGDKPQGEQGQQEAKISPAEAEQILKAIAAQEERTREKVEEEKAKQAGVPSRRNW